MIFEKYNKALTYSYVFGAFGTLELLDNKTSKCKAVLIDPSFIKNEAFIKIKEKCDMNNIPLIIDLKTIDKIRDKGNIFVIGVFEKYDSTIKNGNHLILYGINDTGLIGTVIRSMNGFGYHNLILIDCDVDVYDEHLVRSTMGSFFHCNTAKYNDLKSYMNNYPNNQIYCITGHGKPLSIINTERNISLLFSQKEINNSNIENIEFNKDISLDNIVNIVLFTLYRG